MKEINKNRYMGYHALYGNPIKRKIVRFIYLIIFGPLFQTSFFKNFITACLIDPFKVMKIRRKKEQIHGFYIRIKNILMTFPQKIS